MRGGKTGWRWRADELPLVFGRCARRAVRPLSFDDSDGRSRRCPIGDRRLVLRFSAPVLDQWLGHPRLLPAVLPAWLAPKVTPVLVACRSANGKCAGGRSLLEITSRHSWRDDLFPALNPGHGVRRFVPMLRNRPIAISLSGTAGVRTC